jgi:hypothetical protein
VFGPDGNCVYEIALDRLQKVVQRSTNLRFVSLESNFEVAFLGNSPDYPSASKLGPQRAVEADPKDFDAFRAVFRERGLLEVDTSYIWWTLLAVTGITAALLVLLFLFVRGII